mmetsp:Transcript_63647/g.74565  ORF Transcript_63647/g.74565 Transcript_63647/m.74565 type:complete len:151 (+) Transcript_63647:144-596(+)
MATLIGITDILKLARIIAFRNALDGSYVNEVERMMSFFNLPLAGRDFARDPSPSDKIEKKVKACNSMKKLQDLASSNARVEAEWGESTSRSKSELVRISSRVRVNEKNASPFELQDIHADVKTLQRYVCHTYEYTLDCTTKAELEKTRYK